MDNKKFNELLQKFGEKNPTFIRTAMEHHHIEGSYKIHQGKVIEWEYKAQAKREN